jgi:hypothetical protein
MIPRAGNIQCTNVCLTELQCSTTSVAAAAAGAKRRRAAERRQRRRQRCRPRAKAARGYGGPGDAAHAATPHPSATSVLRMSEHPQRYQRSPVSPLEPCWGDCALFAGIFPERNLIRAGPESSLSHFAHYVPPACPLNGQRRPLTCGVRWRRPSPWTLGDRLAGPQACKAVRAPCPAATGDEPAQLHALCRRWTTWMAPRTTARWAWSPSQAVKKSRR